MPYARKPLAMENAPSRMVEAALANEALIQAFVRALDLREREAPGHGERVAALTVRLAGLIYPAGADMVPIRHGALLHDIGKMGIPESILHKPGPLDDDEWVVMRKHPQLGHDLLSPVPFMRGALDIPLAHHERWDGKGYPRGLSGDQIPLSARIFTVVDVWDALTSERPYRPAWPEKNALPYIAAQAGTHFDPHIVDAFMKAKLFQTSKV